MNETIYDLIDAIKEDKRYLQFKEQSLKLLNQETKELLDNYQNLLQVHTHGLHVPYLSSSQHL